MGPRAWPKSGEFWLQSINAEALNSQPLRRRVGYLNTLEDILKHLGHRMEPFLPELLALTVLLQGATSDLITPQSPSAAGNGGGDGIVPEEEKEKEEGGKEIRSRVFD